MPSLPPPRAGPGCQLPSSISANTNSNTIATHIFSPGHLPPETPPSKPEHIIQKKT
ncbi:uncharacterized protein M6B38_385810 [Iris pallida]|uniref:Uncharacterized protein n=1 Tax=Iris pallida TaxID=29817 RepID=A0AAX6G2S9_IRIPA|nr:uncharacterized protein M6B38_385810 [Iris pallida]